MITLYYILNKNKSVLGIPETILYPISFAMQNQLSAKVYPRLEHIVCVGSLDLTHPDFFEQTKHAG